MSRPKLEVADIFRRHGAAWRAANRAHLSLGQRRVMTAIEVCRTAALGGHVERCEDCAHTRIAYNSCRNRHCPKCQWPAAQAWMAAREAELLPVPYFHVVFTLPAAIGAIAYQNKAKVYGLLFTAAAETLTTIAADPKHLGADIGVTAVLHTWGQNLQHHPHVHCIVPGGGLSPDGERWIACRSGFFLPVRVLSRLFRRLFLQGLEAMHAAGELAVLHRSRRSNSAKACKAYLAPLRKSEWVVYAKKPFAGPEQVLAYLARYTHRVAISNSRLLDLDATHVSFRWKDYRENGRHQQQSHAPPRRRVHAPLPAPRPPDRLPSHSPLRPVRQRPPRRQARPLPAGLLNVPSPQTNASSDNNEPDLLRPRTAAMPLLRRSHDRSSKLSMAHSLGPITSASSTACSEDSPCFLLQPRNQAYRRHGHDHAPPALFRAAASLQQNHRRTTHTAANRAICSRSQRHSVRSFLACLAAPRLPN